MDPNEEKGGSHFNCLLSLQGAKEDMGEAGEPLRAKDGVPS